MKNIKARSVKLKKILDVPCYPRVVRTYVVALIFLSGLVAVFELAGSNIFFNSIQAQIKFTTHEKIPPLIFNKTD